MGHALQRLGIHGSPLTAAERKRYLTAVVQLCELRRTSNGRAKASQIDHSPTLPDSIRLTSGHQKHQALSHIMLYIDQHFRDSIDQRDLAKRCGMTTFRFSRVFKEANGLGFTDYVLNKRMSFAKELLDNSQMPITSIGYEAGFKDPSYFARAFKQYASCTPVNTALRTRCATRTPHRHLRTKRLWKRLKTWYTALRAEPGSFSKAGSQCATPRLTGRAFFSR